MFRFMGTTFGVRAWANTIIVVPLEIFVKILRRCDRLTSYQYSHITDTRRFLCRNLPEREYRLRQIDVKGNEGIQNPLVSEDRG